MKVGQYQLLFLIGLLMAFCLGITCSAWWNISFSACLPHFIILLLVFSTASGILALKQHEYTWIAFAGLFFMLGAFRFAAAYELPAQDISHELQNNISIVGSILDAPRITVDADGVQHIRYTVSVHGVRQGKEEHSRSGKLFIYTRGADQDLSEIGNIGDELRADGKVRRPHGYQNPGQIDTAFLLRTQGITASLSAKKNSVSITPNGDISYQQQFMRWAAELRAHYLERMSAIMPRTDAAAIFAMLFGGYEGIRPELLESFTTTGIVHILSVSGSHISLLAAVIAWLAAFFRLPKWIGAAAVISAVVVYVILAGGVPPAVRSGIMGGVAFLGLVLGREKDAQYLLIVTGLFMLIISPLLFFHISFQLSFLATAGLLFLAPLLNRWMKRLPHVLAGSLSITIAAQLAALPILAWHFNQVSFSSLFSNLFVVPLVELIIILGLAGGLAAFIVPILGNIVFSFDSILLGAVFEMTRALAALPFSKIWLPSMGILPGICYYILLVFICMPKEYRTRIYSVFKEYRQAIGIACCVLLISVVFWRALLPNEMEVHFIDVGQGDCALVLTPHGHAMFFDTGGTKDGSFDIGARVDIPYLLHYGIREVDYIFLSHAHEDHAAGAGAILSRIPVKHVYTADEGRAAYARSMRFGDNNPLLSKMSRAVAGQTIVIDGVSVDILYAPPYDKMDSATGNEVSNVYRVRYGNCSFLFTGDLIKEHEEKMISMLGELHATVVKVPHHGSDTSSSEDFVAATSPLYAVYCVGADNSFGHPRSSVVERYERNGAKTLRTDRDGAIVFRTDGNHLTVHTFAEGKIFGD